MPKFIETNSDSLKHFIDGKLFSKHIGGMYSPDSLFDILPALTDGDS